MHGLGRRMRPHQSSQDRSVRQSSKETFQRPFTSASSLQATAEHCDKSIHPELSAVANCRRLDFEQIKTDVLPFACGQRDHCGSIITPNGRSRRPVRIPEQTEKGHALAWPFNLGGEPLRRLDRNGLHRFLRLGALREGDGKQALGEGRLDLCLVNFLRHLERALERRNDVRTYSNSSSSPRFPDREPALFEFGLALVDALPLTPSVLSKAGRAAELLSGKPPEPVRSASPRCFRTCSQLKDQRGFSGGQASVSFFGNFRSLSEATRLRRFIRCAV